MDDKKHGVVAVTACRVCQGRLDWILNFGHMPLANRYPATKDEKDFNAPLEVMICQSCGCVQLRHTVDPDILFSEYLYTSSTSGSLAEYFRQYAQDTVDKLGWKPGDEKFVVGIGGNDGPLEREFICLGFDCLNVEPAANIADLSRRNNVPTHTAWFTEEVAREIAAGPYGQADLITCNHCFAHMPDINGVVRGIKLLLKPGGTFIFEESYWPDMVAGNHFDQIYHEHVFYWTVRALEGLFYEHGMRIIDVEHNRSQGGSIRGYVQHGNVSTGIADFLIGELQGGAFDLSIYQEWNRRILRWQDECLRFLKSIDSACCYGVPAKFAMISQQVGFNTHWIRYAVEDSPIKVGRFTPGSRIPIVDQKHFMDHPTEHCIITAANYANMIIETNQHFDGKWILLHPEPRFL